MLIESWNHVPHCMWNNVPIQAMRKRAIQIEERPPQTAVQPKPGDAAARPKRADAQRKQDSIVQAATKVFAASGVDAPVREIAEEAGVGLGTVYRHFPKRSDLIAAVMQTQVDACADAASALAEEYEPDEALSRWLRRFMDFLGTKRGLAAALHSGDPTYRALPDYFLQRVGGALGKLLDDAVEANLMRPDIDAEELLWTVATICRGPHGEEPRYARRMVDVLMDGLRSSAIRELADRKPPGRHSRSWRKDRGAQAATAR